MALEERKKITEKIGNYDTISSEVLIDFTISQIFKSGKISKLEKTEKPSKTNWEEKKMKAMAQITCYRK